MFHEWVSNRDFFWFRVWKSDQIMKLDLKELCHDILQWRPSNHEHLTFFAHFSDDYPVRAIDINKWISVLHWRTTTIRLALTKFAILSCKIRTADTLVTIQQINTRSVISARIAKAMIHSCNKIEENWLLLLLFCEPFSGESPWLQTWLTVIHVGLLKQTITKYKIHHDEWWKNTTSSKTKWMQQVKLDFSLFWWIKYVACYAARRILYHVTVSW